LGGRTKVDFGNKFRGFGIKSSLNDICIEITVVYEEIFVNKPHDIRVLGEMRWDFVIDEVMNGIEVFAIAGVEGDVFVFDSYIFEKI